MNAMTEIVHNFPEPTAPVSPILSSHSCTVKKQSIPDDSILALPNSIQVSSGRAAIALALEHEKIKAGDEILIPAFHCESMVSPVKWRKATPVFYSVHMDASINVQDIAKKITPATKAIIATHYFGFLQDLNELRALCDQHEILLIEDCAHAFFGRGYGHNVGEWGDYAIASSMKFFPVYDGGVLASNKHSLSAVTINRPPASFTAKSLINTLEKSIRFSRLGLMGKVFGNLLRIQSKIRHTLKSNTPASNQEANGPVSSDGGYGLDENWIHKKSTPISSFIIRHTNFQLNKETRQKHYQMIDARLRTIPGIRPLFPELPESMSPLIYPAFIEHPEKFFAPLKELGIPIWRFGEYLDPMVDESVCPNSTTLSAHIFQFPCHQELKEEELKWMLDTIASTFRD